MSDTILVSRQGLTRCPSCLSHVAVEPSLESTVCPFCDAPLLAARREAEGTMGRRANQLLGTTSAALAAVFGVSLTAACGGVGEVGIDTPVPVVAPERPQADIYGGPPQDAIPKRVRVVIEVPPRGVTVGDRALVRNELELLIAEDAVVLETTPSQVTLEVSTDEKARIEAASKVVVHNAVAPATEPAPPRIYGGPPLPRSPKTP